ncbi:MAG: hypothetical protein Q9212_004958 [Teloschistes hypoglaucus]
MAGKSLNSGGTWLMNELGVYSILGSPRDTKILCLQRFVRLFGYGVSTLILALYLSSINVSDAKIGLFMTLTIWGDVVISLVLTLFADGLGRRRTLMLGAALMTVSGLVFALSGNYWILVVASIIGVISPNGNEIGPFKAIEESALSQLSPAAIRSDIFAWYTLLGNAGTACGIIICGWLVKWLKSLDGWTPTRAYRIMFGLYAFLGLVKLGLSIMLSDKVELQMEKQEYQQVTELTAVEIESLLSSDDDEDEAIQPDRKSNTKPTPPTSPTKKRSILPSISPASRGILISLCILFSFDSFASGIASATWITYFFTTKFSLPESTVGTLFAATSIIAALSNLVASAIAKRIGLLKTMVFTHLPSAVFLALIPAPKYGSSAAAGVFGRRGAAGAGDAPRADDPSVKGVTLPVSPRHTSGAMAMWAPADLFTPTMNAVTLSLVRIVSYLYESPMVLLALLLAIAALIAAVTLLTGRRKAG